MTGKHTIYYRDGDIEHLKLEEERWRLSKIKKQPNESGKSADDPSPPPPSTTVRRATAAAAAGGGVGGGRGKRKRRKRQYNFQNKKKTSSSKSNVANRLGNESDQRLSIAASAAGEGEEGPADSRMYIAESSLSMVFLPNKAPRKGKEDRDDDTAHKISFAPLSDDGWTLIPISPLFLKNCGTTSTSRTGTKKNHKLLSKVLKRIARKSKPESLLPLLPVEPMAMVSVQGKRVPKRSKIYDDIEKVLKPKSRKSRTEELPEKVDLIRFDMMKFTESKRDRREREREYVYICMYVCIYMLS